MWVVNLNFLDMFFNPSDWPRIIRRLFVLTIPISGPVYILLAFLLLFIMGLGILIVEPISRIIEKLYNLWNQ